MLRGLRVVLVVLLLGTGGGVVAAGAAPASSATVATKRSGMQCAGLDRSDVRGDEPTYTRKRLAEFRNHQRVCRGIWLPEPRRYLVPQGLAVLGRTAWVSGFRYRKGYGQRPCQLVRVSLVTGKRVQFHAAIYGRVGNRPRTYCRHGGGILQRGSYLWIVEKNKLWQVDPSKKKRVLTARRVWRIASPVRGSAIVATRKRIGLVPFQTKGRAYIHWFAIKKLKRPGVLDLGARSRGPSQLGAVARTRVPTYVQGATIDARGRLYLARSTLACGELVTPGGRRLGFVPGAEGIQFSPLGKRLYAVSESGARPYVKSRKPLTPAVSAFEWPGLVHGRKPNCGFPRY
jgi:hypothetical protein